MNTEMIEAATIRSSAPDAERLEAAREACQRIAPLWPLQSFVAVNPFVGVTERSFADACALYARLVPGGMQMPAEYYRAKWNEGRITAADLAQAVKRVSDALPEAEITRADVESFLTKSTPPGAQVLTLAEVLDAQSGTEWASAITDQVSQFCAAYYDTAQSAWRFPWQKQPLYAAWRNYAQLDRSAEIDGLDGLQARIAEFPASAGRMIVQALEQLRVPQDCAADFLHKELLSIRGWAGHVQYRSREQQMRGGKDESLLELLAIRLAYDVLLLERFGEEVLPQFWSHLSAEGSATDVNCALAWQVADEIAWHRQLVGKITAKAPALSAAKANARPAVQAVFCIDVRSEVFRRAFEAASPRVETLGFAGFFGMPLEHVQFGERGGAAQCPVLLTPKFRVPERPRGGERAERSLLGRHRFIHRLNGAWSSFKLSAISCFSFVETAGLASGPVLLRDAFGFGGRKRASGATHFAPDVSHLPLEDRVALAYGALRNMGLTTNFAPLVLLCGHGSVTRNNPYAAGLDCGACGGHAGDVNARVAAAILNDAAVRMSLKDRGVGVPEDTWFIAGLHTTTTDEVVLYDLDSAPQSHAQDIEQMREWLAQAGAAARRERAGALGLNVDSGAIYEAIAERSRDWAQVRPEWGLAGNAAFIAAPRSRTKHLNLGGRVFLHSYDWRLDPDNSTLELILTAPVVVANWISLQYFASTANNAVFGSGNKVLHNVVASIGVCLGNGGDLQTGLPLQSVHDGEKWMHEPLRLHVLIEAARERIEAVLAKHEGVRRLVENEWLLLSAIEEDGKRVSQRRSAGVWEPSVGAN